jgi:hypothetical protein
MSKWYRTGTVTVTNGSDQVTGVATYWDSAADKPAAGDIFTDNSGLYEVSSIESDGALTLDRAFEGFTQVNQPYAIIKVISQNGMTRVAGQVSDVLAELGDKITVSTSAPASSQGKDGDIWVVVA